MMPPPFVSMALSPGSRIGPYEIGPLIGAGGMGEVYRATDMNLGRPAAIKVLPDAVAQDAERLGRFEREAKTLAALNHPNIAQVFGFEKGDGNVRALAMEYVDGPTLADRIDGLPMPIDEALAIAVQIADALESAHDHGIVHRDLKPLNIKVRPDGTVKVLDFGLAKILTTASESAAGLSAKSPTITTPAMTHAGVVLGTAAYMSPEQAKGRIVDRRADIWAFGCVLFEILSGRRVFTGDDVSDVMVSILRDEPRWSALPSDTPPHVRSLLQRCLQKDVRKRLPHIGVARLELAEPSASAASIDDAGWPRTIPLVAAAVVAAAIGISSWMLWSRPPAPLPLTHLRVDLGLGSNVLVGPSALSPDGRILALTAGASPESAPLVYIRHLDRLGAQPLAGTEGAQSPFFSPDGKWIAFFAGDTLKKVAVSGGPVLTICQARAPRGGWWGADDVIVFASPEGLSRISAAGGTPEFVARVLPGQPPPSSPQVLPRGRGILYWQSLTSDPRDGIVSVQDLAGGPPREILRGGRIPRYVDSGHVTFVSGGTLFAVPFDLDTLTTRGEAVPVVEGLFQAGFNALANLAFSTNGTLAYQPGSTTVARQAPVMWLSATAALSPLRATPATFAFPKFSPDGKRLAMAVWDGRQSDIWVYDWERDIVTRVTNHPGLDVGAVWTSDGTGLVFASDRGSSILNLYWQRADATGEAQRLTTSNAGQIPDSFTPDGKQLVFHEGNPARGQQSLAVLPVERDSTRTFKAGVPAELIGGAFLKANARVSPDGKWISYAANDTGTFEIYVQPFSGPGDRVQVSNGGGSVALWSPTKSELYYAGSGQVRMMAVPYSANENGFTPAKARQWADTPFSSITPLGTYGPSFDLHPDGTRFAVAPPQQAPTDSDSPQGQMVLLFNLFDELRRLAPPR